MDLWQNSPFKSAVEGSNQKFRDAGDVVMQTPNYPCWIPGVLLGQSLPRYCH